MDLFEHTNICDLLKAVPTMAGVLKRLGISDMHIAQCDSLGEVVRCSGISLAEIIREFELLQSGGEYNREYFSQLPVPEMVALLRREHHDFLTRRLPRMAMVLRELAQRKGKEQADLLHLLDAFEDFRADISEHILQEQDSLYPYAEQLYAFLEGKITADDAAALLNNPSPCSHALRCDEDLGFFDKARYYTNHFTPPQTAGIMQRSLYRELAQFEKDLLRHEAVEFEVLLGKVVQLEDMAWQALGKRP
ncbi:MAG: hypothetical protein ACK417_12610 [Bacteroidia bacterium]